VAVTTVREVAALIARHLPPPNPILPAVLTTDTGLVNGTPSVLVRVGDETRPATYLPPLAIRQGNVFVTRAGAALTAPIVVLTTNYQVPVAVVAPTASTGSTLGYGSTAATPSANWAAAMTDPTNTDGALMPLTLGEVAH